MGKQSYRDGHKKIDEEGNRPGLNIQFSCLYVLSSVHLLTVSGFHNHSKWNLLFLFRDDWTPLTADDIVILEVRNSPDGGVDVTFYVKSESASDTTQVLPYDVVEASVQVSFKYCRFEQF